MRTGAIFARGSCRALKWMALVGVVFALGAASAVAQDGMLRLSTTDEGTSPTATLTLPAAVAAGAGDSTFTLSIVAYDGDVPRLTGRSVADASGLIGGTDGVALGGTATVVVAEGETTGLRVGALVFDHDSDAEDEYFTLRATSGATVIDTKVIVRDDEVQDYTLELPSEAGNAITESAGQQMLTLTAKPAKSVAIPVALALSPNDPTKYTLGDVMNTDPGTPAPTTEFGTEANNIDAVTATIEAMDDGNRTLDRIIVTAYTGSLGASEEIKSLTINVKDANPLPMVEAMVVDDEEMALAPQPTSIDEGETVKVKLTVLDDDGDPAAAAEALSVSLMQVGTASSSDYRVMSPITIASGAMSSTVELTAQSDQSVDPGETLMFNASVSGEASNGPGTQESPNILSLMINDRTRKQVSVKAGAEAYIERQEADAAGSDGLNPGEDFSLMTSMLFEAAVGYTFRASSDSSDSTKVSEDDGGDSITIMPESVGSAMITITAVASPAASSFDVTQTTPNVAEITFEVDVVAAATAAPDRPAAPTFPRRTQTSLDVSWKAPNDNGSTITHYDLRYKMQRATDWTVREMVRTTSATLTDLSPGTSYDVQVRAGNAVGKSEWSKSGPGETLAAPVPTVKYGQIDSFKLIGDVENKTIAGTERHHVPEGSQGVELEVIVRWTHEEIEKIGYDRSQNIFVEIRSGGSGSLPNWLSWIDPDGQDVHFPTTAGLRGTVTVKTPKESSIPPAQRGDRRLSKTDDGRLSVLILHDDHEAEEDAFYIAAYDGDVKLGEPVHVDRTTLDVVIEDDEDQEVTIGGWKTLYEPAGDPRINSSPSYRISAKPPRRDLPLEVRLDMVDLQGNTVEAGLISLGASSVTLNDKSSGTGNTVNVSVNLPSSDGNRVNNSYKLKASVNSYSVASGGYEAIPVAEHEILVLDRHKLPKLTISPQTATVKEGGKAELALTINRNPADTIVKPSGENSNNVEKRQYTDEEVTIMLTMGAGSTAGASDFSVMTNPVTFPERKSGSFAAEMTVEVMALDDDELDDMEMLVLDAMVSGAESDDGTEKDSYAGLSTLTIEDSTNKLVWAKTQAEVEAAIYAAKNAGMGDDETLNPGEMFEVMGSALFNAAEGVTVSYSAMTSDNSVASTAVDSGGATMVTAKGAGMADVTITAHASMASGVKIGDQSDPTEASIMFPVEVGLAALSITLSGPEDMNVVEGGMGAMVTATANRAVTEEVTVMLMRDRAMSSAGDDDYTAEPIVIAAGVMSGSTMVMAVEDGLMESVDNMAEELVLYGMTEGMAGEVTGEVKLYLWDAAVPALPVIAQLVLAAFLAVGGYRRYRRR